MKPLRLEFQAFGSYPNREVVDFTVLAKRGLFVVTGPTGSGKTTIFDAMVYALYGSFPGNRENNEEARSHHAAANVETYVQFDFEVDGVRYRVHRAPSQERAAKRGSGTTIATTKATLVRMVDGKPEAVEQQAKRVSDACEAFVGLDADQFQRVVLLPQGRFTAFLLANEREREELLRPLFGGEVYRRATDWLKDHKERLESEVREVDIEVQHFRSNAVASLREVRLAWKEMPDADGDNIDQLHDDELQEAIDALEPARAQREYAVDALQRAARETQADAATAEAAVKVFDSAESATRRLVELSALADAITVDREQVDASRRARPVHLAAEELRSAESTKQEATRRLDAVLHSVAHGFEQLGREAPAVDPGIIGAAVQAVKQDLDQDEQLLAAAQAAVGRAHDTERELSAARDEFLAVQATVVGLRGQIDEVKRRIGMLEPDARSVAQSAVLADAARDRLAARRDLEEMGARRILAQAQAEAARINYEAVMSRFVATQAPRLAEQLRKGEACPVCGSTQHPTPATFDDAEQADHAAVDAARAAWAEQASAVATRDGQIETLSSSLGAAVSASIPDLDAALQTAERAVEAGQNAARLLGEAQKALASLEASLLAAIAHEREGAGAIRALEGVLVDRRAESNRLAVASAGLVAETLAAHAGVLFGLESAIVGLASRFAAVTSAADAFEAAHRTLVDVLASSGYHSVDAASGQLLDESTERKLDARVSAWTKERDDTIVGLDTLRAQGIPDSRPDVEVLRERARTAADAANVEAREFTTAANALKAAGAALARAVQTGSASAGIRGRCDDARRVYRTCHGDTAFRVTLERWVLARELERVTGAANVHLARMSNHRYQLWRDDSQGGLKLEVFDAHTGRTRTTNSLSGGEQFQASLSLALGLADVVSRGGSASGKQFEALFVDEGFGSLDQRSLGDAINALEQIQATGRMVGAITHVDEMKERLHKGIEVTRLDNDAGSTLRVNP